VNLIQGTRGTFELISKTSSVANS